MFANFDNLSSNLRYLFASWGGVESLNYIFGNKRLYSKFLQYSSFIKIMNPMGDHYEVLRQSLIPGLIQNIVCNQKRNIYNLKIYEIGSVYSKRKKKEETYIDKTSIHPYIEQTHIASIFSGYKEIPHYTHKNIVLNYYNLKGLLNYLLYSLGLNNSYLKKNNLSLLHNMKETYLHPNINSAIYVNSLSYMEDICIGYMGELHPSILSYFKIKQKLLILELDINLIDKLLCSSRFYKTITKYPIVQRDISLLLDNNIKIKIITDNIIKHPMFGCNISKLKIFDMYQKPPKTDSFRSLGFTLMLSNYQNTLTDSHIDLLLKKMMSSLDQIHGVNFR